MGGVPKYKSLDRLTPRESKFLLSVISGTTQADAYRRVAPGVSDGTARSMGNRYMRSIKEKLDWPDLMDEVGLGTTRFLTELERRLTALKTEFYKGQAIADVEDNATRMKATELLADLHGLRKSEVDVKHSGVINVLYDKEFEGV